MSRPHTPLQLMPFGPAITFLCFIPAIVSGEPGAWQAAEVVDVCPVWAGHPVRFALLTHGRKQFVACYDAQRQMTVAARSLESDQWRFTRLPTSVAWDSHNSIIMTVDDDDRLHLSGNMHCVPLIYFRTSKPLDIGTFERIPSMVGPNEQRCTYPKFIRGPQNELVFTYRDGSSGSGNQIGNVYDHATQSWRRLLDQPLFFGQGKMNAYFVGPVQDAKGVYHVCWVWRDTPDCATNHDLSYARTEDMVHWQTSDGEPLELPITADTAEIVDPVPPGGGIINGNTKIGFDSQDRVILSYHKYDADGKTQIHNARRETGGWKIYQTSDWDYRWEFSGGGTIPFEVAVGSVTLQLDGSLTQTYRNSHHGSGNWLLDEETLKPKGKAPGGRRMPREIGRIESNRPKMGVRTAGDSGSSGSKDVRYLLRWETQPSNRDRPHPGDPPPPSMLRVYKLVADD